MNIILFVFAVALMLELFVLANTREALKKYEARSHNAEVSRLKSLYVGILSAAVAVFFFIFVATEVENAWLIVSGAVLMTLCSVVIYFQWKRLRLVLAECKKQYPK